MEPNSNSSSLVIGLLTTTVACAIVAGCDEARADNEAGATSSTLPFHGTFWADVNGQRIVLHLEQNGSAVTGTVDAATLSGRADGTSARGEVRDPQSPQVSATFEMRRTVAALEFTLTVRDSASGQALDVPTITLAPGEPPRVDAKLDRNAVGRWRHTWTRVSGDFSVAIDLSMLLNADGTFAYGDSKMAGGGAHSGFEGSSGEVERGHWRAEAGVLYASQDNGATWHRYALYAIDGDTMMLTYDNGKRQIWERQ